MDVDGGYGRATIRMNFKTRALLFGRIKLDMWGQQKFTQPEIERQGWLKLEKRKQKILSSVL